MSAITLEVPDGWRQTNIRSISTIKSGSTPSRLEPGRYFVGGTIPWIKTMDLTNGRIYSTDERITELAVQETSCPILEPGTVLVAMYGGYNQIGRTGLMTFAGSINQAISALITDRTRAIPEYVLYWLNANLHLWKRFAASSRKDPNITRQDVGGFPILLPPLAEQRKIAAILSTWDEAIALTERLIAALQQRKQGLMQRLLTGQVRFPGFEGEWRRVELGEVVKPVSRTEAVNPGKEYRLIGVRWYVAGAHIHETISGSQIVTGSLSRIQENDILYNKMWVTKAAFGIARKEHNGAYGTSEYPQFQAQQDKLDVDFMGYIFHDAHFQYEATRLCRGTTGRARLNPSDFLEIVIRLPELDEQSQIADFLQTCDQEIALFSSKLERLKEQKKGLMQRLLTGEIRVKVD